MGKDAYHNRKFDFEIGYLIKSPCKRCLARPEFPKCIDTCETLDKIHGIMAPSVSCSRSYSSSESTVSGDGWKE